MTEYSNTPDGLKPVEDKPTEAKTTEPKPSEAKASAWAYAELLAEYLEPAKYIGPVLVHMDSLELMKGFPSAMFNMVFMDPPFNIGQGYEGYNDKVREADFRAFIFNVVGNVWRVSTGAICLHGPDALAEMYLDMMRNVPRIAWINWCYSFGQYQEYNWTNGREHCLVYSKVGKLQFFNAEAVKIPSVRMLMGDKRASGKRIPSNVWGLKYDEGELVPLEPLQNEPNWGRVQGNNPERVPERPNQLPAAYMTRLISAYTKPGWLVYDPFCGTGTTATTCATLGRRCLTSDIDEGAIKAASRRLDSAGVRHVVLRANGSVVIRVS